MLDHHSEDCLHKMPTSSSLTPYSILNPTTCVKKGFCPVGHLRDCQSRRLYYEIHGDLQGSQKIVLITGLMLSSAAWLEQVNHFGGKPDHAVLVLDNRGSGNSDCGSVGPYRTSELARDLVELLDFLGWDQERSLHVFGVSLGGMISQEMGLLIPERIKSISFISTRSGNVFDVPSPRVLAMFFKVVFSNKTPKEGFDALLECLYPTKHLEEATPDGRTRKDELRDYYSTWFNVPRQQSSAAIFGQTCAGFLHHCPEEKLAHMAAALCPAKIAVISGDRDEIIYPMRSLQLQDHLPGSELVIFKQGGHLLNSQVAEEFNALMERIISEGNQNFAQR